jgi:hypothetical protein
MKNSGHKWNGEKNGSRIGNNSFNAEKLADIHIRPGKNKHQGHAHYPIDERDALEVSFAKLGLRHVN